MSVLNIGVLNMMKLECYSICRHQNVTLGLCIVPSRKSIVLKVKNILIFSTIIILIIFYAALLCHLCLCYLPYSVFPFLVTIFKNKKFISIFFFKVELEKVVMQKLTDTIYAA